MGGDELCLHRAVTTVHVPEKIWDVTRKTFKIMIQEVYPFLGEDIPSHS